MAPLGISVLRRLRKAEEAEKGCDLEASVSSIESAKSGSITQQDYPGRKKKNHRRWTVLGCGNPEREAVTIGHNSQGQDMGRETHRQTDTQSELFDSPLSHTFLPLPLIG